MKPVKSRMLMIDPVIPSPEMDDVKGKTRVHWRNYTCNSAPPHHWALLQHKDKTQKTVKAVLLVKLDIHTTGKIV